MTTSHTLARELLDGPDLPISHFDPSCAGYDEERDTGLSAPVIQVLKPEEYEDPNDGEMKMTLRSLIIVGNQHEEHGLNVNT